MDGVVHRGLPLIGRYDVHQRRIAAQLQRENPCWFIMWGCYSRQFWAFPLFSVPSRTIVTARDAEKLLAMMYAAERHPMWPPRGSSPAGPGGEVRHRG
jgi:hypothetical protein